MLYDYVDIECTNPTEERVNQIKQWFTDRLPIAYGEDGFYHVPYSLRDCKEMLVKEIEQVNLDAISNLATEYDGEIMLECLRHFARGEYKEIAPGVLAMGVCDY